MIFFQVSLHGKIRNTHCSWFMHSICNASDKYDFELDLLGLLALVNLKVAHGCCEDRQKLMPRLFAMLTRSVKLEKKN